MALVTEELAPSILGFAVLSWWLIKNVPKFAMKMYGSRVEFKQKELKELTVLKSNHS